MMPIQPTVVDDKGVLRFRKNLVVEYLLNHGGLDMNAIVMWAIQVGIPDDDLQQFAQLIGYSLDGYADLSYASDRVYKETYRRAVKGGSLAKCKKVRAAKGL